MKILGRFYYLNLSYCPLEPISLKSLLYTLQITPQLAQITPPLLSSTLASFLIN